ncbi:MAG: hypothetical protein H6Q52_3284 [Deltaproteobacteria bacterium]|nr:hypothetical protein [Deltaproteobacteria bacterium]
MDTTDKPVMASATLAEIYLEQGYVEMSIKIYAELVHREPGNKDYKARLSHLKKEFKADKKKGILKNFKLWNR